MKWKNRSVSKHVADAPVVHSYEITRRTSMKSGTDMAIWKILGTNGALDLTFNSVGYLTHNGAGAGTSNASGSVIKRDLAGRLIVGGASEPLKGNADMTLWRFSPTGVLDTSFSNTGFYYQNGAAGGDGNDAVTDLTFDSSNRLIVTGYSAAANMRSDFTVWVFKGY